MTDLASELEGAPIAARPIQGDGGDAGGADAQAETGGAAPSGGKADKPERPRGEIWEGCPVQPLGQLDGISYYLDSLGQLRGINKHERQAIMMLFGRFLPRLIWNFPRWNMTRDGEITGRKDNDFNADYASQVMIQAINERGLFDPEGTVRGRGAWADDDGHLIYHLGNQLLMHGATSQPTTHQGKIYPALPAIPAPAQAINDAAPNDLLSLIETWQWTRPDLDPMVMLGMTGVQMLGGALEWRPAYWITGGAGTGKSNFQRLNLHLHGGEKGLIQSTDPTARGIASVLKNDTLPVALDELEPSDEGSHKEKAIIEAARVASSGGRWLRGSSDQKGSSGQFRSTFFFSSIIVPGALKSQDRQRIIIVNLDKFPPGTTEPPIKAATWQAKGAAIKRALIDRWPSFERRLDLFREAFAAEKIEGRDFKNWGTTLAMGQMMLSADMPSADELAGWARKVAGVISQHTGEAMTDDQECLLHLLSHRYDPFRRGVQYTLAQWIMAAAALPGAPEGLLDGRPDDTQFEREARAKKANAQLAPLLIKVIADPDTPRLFIGRAQAQPLAEVFAHTQWKGGAWTQSLERLPGAQKGPSSRTLAGIPTRGTEIPLSALPGLQAFPQDRDVPETRAQAQGYDPEAFA